MVRNDNKFWEMASGFVCYAKSFLFLPRKSGKPLMIFYAEEWPDQILF